MFLRGKDLIPLVHGAVDHEETKEGIIFLRFPASFREKLSQSVSYAACGAGISLCFMTDAAQVHISFTLKDAVSCETVPPAIDLHVDEKLLFHQPIPIKKEMRNEYIFALCEGPEKEIRLWLPYQAILAIDSLELVGATRCETLPATGKRILALADSITQGFYCDAPSLTYFNRLVEKLGAKALNQGIGGYYFSPETVMKTDFEPDLILVALGTNDYFNGDKNDIPGFFRAVREEYPDIPIVAVSPIVRMDTEIPALQIEGIQDAIRKELDPERGDIFINGQNLLPRESDLFEDRLHPNRRGMEMLADRLLDCLREAGAWERNA